MRKFLALALAVAMVLSMASVSFAIEPVSAEGDIVLSKFYKYSGDSDKLQDKQAEYGKSYYAVIYEGKGVLDITQGTDDEALDDDDTYTVSYAPISNYKAVEKLKVKAEFEMGEDLVESVSIVKKGFNASAAVAPTEDVEGITYTYADPDWTPGSGTAYTGEALTGYYYCVEIKTKADRVTGDADIIGTLEFNRKAKDGITKIDDDKVDFALNLWYENKYVNEDGTSTEYTVDDEASFKWDDKYVLKFDSDDEVTLNFGYENEGEFTVDASGQGKMVIDFNTKANEAIYAANEGVKMFFVNFNGAKFNRTGTFEYEMEDMVAAYEVVDDQLVEIRGLELDGDTAIFATRTLGNYVFANAELVNPAAAVEAPVVEAPAAVTNPSTGA